MTAILSTLVMRQVLRSSYWKPETDEEVDEAMVAEEALDAEAAEKHDSSLPLVVLMLPILVPLVMIAFGAFAELLEFSTPFIAFIGNANIALFVGLVGAYLLSRHSSGAERTDHAMAAGFHTTGEILLITGVGGSLGAVIKATGLDGTLGDLFSADAGAPVILSILLAWFVAAVLHLAIGSVSVAAITAAGIIAPILDSISVSPVAVGLAIASGATLRPPGQQQLLLDVQGIARVVDQGNAEDPDRGDLDLLADLAAARDRGGAGRTCLTERFSERS